MKLLQILLKNLKTKYSSIWTIISGKTLSDPTPLGLSSVAINPSPIAPQIVVTEAASTSSHNETVPLSNFAPNITDINDEISDEGWEYENTTLVDTRRILYSKTVEKGKRPYMVRS